MEGIISNIQRFSMAPNDGVSIKDARMRTNSGCHWLAIPGREYSMMDCVKINFSVVLDIALREAVEKYGEPTIEKGLDASGGGVEHYLWCVDGAALAVAADSLAAISQRILREHRFPYRQLLDYLDTDWAGPEGEKARLFMSRVDRYGKGGTEADELAVRLSRIFTQEVKAQRTPRHGFQMIPGLFSWANTLTMGATLGATPNGRKAGQPISHGANPGFRQDGAATAMSAAIASVQSGYGNTAPMQIELEPSVTTEASTPSACAPR